jgi:hypothetical protein
VPVDEDVAAERQKAGDEAASITQAARLWLSQQAELSLNLAAAPAIAPLNAVIADATWIIRYKCPHPACECHFDTTSGIRSHWRRLHSTVPVPSITADECRRHVHVGAESSGAEQNASMSK